MKVREKNVENVKQTNTPIVELKAEIDLNWDHYAVRKHLCESNEREAKDTEMFK